VRLLLEGGANSPETRRTGSLTQEKIIFEKEGDMTY